MVRPPGIMDHEQLKISTRNRSRIIKALLQSDGPLTVEKLARKGGVSRQTVYDLMEKDQVQPLPQLRWVGSKVEFRRYARAHDVPLTADEMKEIQETYRPIGASGPLYHIQWKRVREETDKPLVYRVIGNRRERYDSSATLSLRANTLRLEDLTGKPLDLSIRIF